MPDYTDTLQADKEQMRFGLPIKPVERLVKIRDALANMVKAHGDERGRQGMQTLLTLLGNVAKSPEEDKFRRVRLTNEKIKAAVVDNGVPQDLITADQRGSYVLSNPDPLLLRCRWGASPGALSFYSRRVGRVPSDAPRGSRHDPSQQRGRRDPGSHYEPFLWQAVSGLME